MGKRATWIWYPGDFEVWTGNRFNNRRTERGAVFPPFWKQDSHWPTVVFTTTVCLEADEEIEVFCEGLPNIAIDGQLLSPGATDGQLLSPVATDGQLLSPVATVCCDSVATATTTRATIPKGRHCLALKVWNQQSPPALFIDGPTIKTGSHWQTTYEDKIWIDELGVAHGSGIYVPAASWCFDVPSAPPSSFRLPTRPAHPVCCDSVATQGTLYDFGRETFGFLRFQGLRGRGTLRVFYGESREEALDRDRCETLDICSVNDTGGTVAETPFGSKAFRYVFIEKEGTATFDRLTMDEEYAPFDPSKSGTFRCSDDGLNRIWEVSARTLDLTTREFFCDGIKRDRWVWSGDAIQSYLMNYYLRFDTECVKRTIRQLRGKDPVTAHVNTIMDYTFYWFVSIRQYYEYTGDTAFLREMWPKMVTLMDYVLSRTNADGMAEGRPDDWIFVDWTDFPMHKRGSLAFEQILFWKALQTMAYCASQVSRDNSRDVRASWFSRDDSLPDYAALAATLRQRIKDTFWSAGRHAFLHALEDGRLNPQLTKFPNMFAILYGLADDDEKPLIAKYMLLDPGIPPITTPYMRFYELEALCQMGRHADVLSEMKSYWGGMLRLGATSFWEKYVPEEQGTEHLAMYGRPYGKSLCHAWGASPLYILGRYFLGVRPTKPGYEEYEVCPHNGGLEWMEGDVPTPFGKIHVRTGPTAVTVRSDGGKGRLTAFGKTTAIPEKTEVSITASWKKQ